MSDYNIIDADFDGSEFIDNPEPRCPVVLLVDTSGSMTGEPIQELNKALIQFKSEILADTLAKKRVEISVVSFNSTVAVENEFCTPDIWIPPVLSASGATDIGEAVRRGIQLIGERKELYNDNGITYYRPWVFLLTDGYPTDAIDDLAELIEEGEQKSKFMFFPVGIGSDFNKDILSGISQREVLKMKGLAFKEFFSWLSHSLASVSRSQPGESVALPSPLGWGSVA